MHGASQANFLKVQLKVHTIAFSGDVMSELER